MSKNLIDSIQRATTLRLVMPFSLALKTGHVVSLSAKTGLFAVEGNCKTLLGVTAGGTETGQGRPNLEYQWGTGTTCDFRAAGAASSLFPELPKANAGFDIKFDSKDAWILAATKVEHTTLKDVNHLRQPILDAVARGVWKPDWVLITGITMVEKMTLLASDSVNTQLALSLGATVAETAGLAAQLTSEVTIQRQTQHLTKCVTSEPMVAFCTGIRVKDYWWKSPGLAALEEAEEQPKPNEASDEEFWENVILD